MSKAHRTTIEINGRTYDALTGKLMPAKTTRIKPVSTGGVSLDGFISPSASQSHPAKFRPAAAIVAPTEHEVIKPHSTTPSHRVHARRQRSQTLNRAAVTRPKPAKPRGVDSSISRSESQLAGHVTVPPERRARAKAVTKSHAITRFAPEHTEPEGSQSQVIQPVNSQDQASIASAPQTPRLSPKETLIAQSLARIAESAPQPEAKTNFSEKFRTWFKRSRNSTVVASSLATLLLIGYVTYLNIPRVALRVAAGKAGFEAEMPGYNPGGFRFSGPIAYAPGQITLQYKSNTDDRAYTIAQKETTWDSQTLLDNYVGQETELYSTYQEKGLIIYVYNGSTATWVNGGVWYTVTGNSGLTAEQLLKIAASL